MAGAASPGAAAPNLASNNSVSTVTLPAARHGAAALAPVTPGTPAAEEWQAHWVGTLPQLAQISR